MSEVKYLIERGGERQYVLQAELPALLKDGWVVIGQINPVGAVVPQTKAAPAKSKPAVDKPQGGDQGAAG